jgi:hypothetical protein
MPPLTVYYTDASWGKPRYAAQLEGRDRTYRSTMQIDAGIAYGPVFIGTGYQ